MAGAQTGLKLKMYYGQGRAGPKKGTTGRAGPKNLVILPPLHCTLVCTLVQFTRTCVLCAVFFVRYECTESLIRVHTDVLYTVNSGVRVHVLVNIGNTTDPTQWQFYRYGVCCCTSTILSTVSSTVHYNK